METFGEEGIGGKEKKEIKIDTFNFCFGLV